MRVNMLNLVAAGPDSENYPFERIGEVPQQSAIGAKPHSHRKPNHGKHRTRPFQSCKHAFANVKDSSSQNKTGKAKLCVVFGMDELLFWPQCVAEHGYTQGLKRLNLAPNKSVTDRGILVD